MLRSIYKIDFEFIATTQYKCIVLQWNCCWCFFGRCISSFSIFCTLVLFPQHDSVTCHLRDFVRDSNTCDAHDTSLFLRAIHLLVYTPLQSSILFTHTSSCYFGAYSIIGNFVVYTRTSADTSWKRNGHNLTCQSAIASMLLKLFFELWASKWIATF